MADYFTHFSCLLDVGTLDKATRALARRLVGRGNQAQRVLHHVDPGPAMRRIDHQPHAVAGVELAQQRAFFGGTDQMRALDAAAAGGEPVDLILADPPYPESGPAFEAVLAAAAAQLAPGGLMVLERSARDAAPRRPAGLRSGRSWRSRSRWRWDARSPARSPACSWRCARGPTGSRGAGRSAW